MSEQADRRQIAVQGVLIDVLSWDVALGRIETWAANHQSRVVAICNAHSVITAKHDPDFREAVEQSDMATADGTPVAWTIRRLGFPTQERINGPDLMIRYCQRAQHTGQKVFLFGNEQATVDKLMSTLKAEMPGLQFAGAICPPFRPATAAEDAEHIRAINDSGANIVFVSLGCPKQEKWMAEHRNKIHAVMVGVGAAFDYHAGTIRRAPLWMQNMGLEWLHRLFSEPRRLWRRYLTTNTAFIFGALNQFRAAPRRPERKS